MFLAMELPRLCVSVYVNLISVMRINSSPSPRTTRSGTRDWAAPVWPPLAPCSNAWFTGLYAFSDSCLAVRITTPNLRRRLRLYVHQSRHVQKSSVPLTCHTAQRGNPRQGADPCTGVKSRRGDFHPETVRWCPTAL